MRDYFYSANDYITRVINPLIIDSGENPTDYHRYKIARACLTYDWTKKQLYEHASVDEVEETIRRYKKTTPPVGETRSASKALTLTEEWDRAWEEIETEYLDGRPFDFERDSKALRELYLWNKPRILLTKEEWEERKTLIRGNYREWIGPKDD